MTGLAETSCSTISTVSPNVRSPVSVEWIRRVTISTSVPVLPVPGVELELVGEDGYPADLTGEVVLTSRAAALGYVGDDDRSAFEHLSDGRTRVRTGDVARRTYDGSFVVVGRKDDQVKVRGQKVDLLAVERVVRQQSGHENVAVLQRDLGEAGERGLVAFLASPGGSQNHGPLMLQLRERLSPHELPTRFVSIDRIPRTVSGKVDRQALSALKLPADECASAAERAPQSALTRAMAALFADVLGVDSAGPDDDFFALGGHSLKALELVGRIDKELETASHIDLPAVFRYPTPRQLAAIIERTQASSDDASRCLVPLRSGGDKNPLFCIHCGRGRVHHYVALADALDPSRPAIGVQPPALSGADALPDRVEALAAFYVEEIRRAQPEGPYRLCGYSFGGLIALEIAQQLTAAGESVEAVFVIDTTLPADRESGSTSATEHLRALAGLDWPARCSYVAARLRGNLQSLIRSCRSRARRWRTVVRGAIGVAAHGQVSVAEEGDYFYYRCTKTARARYRPKPYRGRVVLFCASERNLGQPRSARSRLARSGGRRAPGDDRTPRQPHKPHAP